MEGSHSTTRLANGEVRIAIQMHDRTGNPIEKAGLVGELRHPSDENHDRVIRLSEISPGTYQATLSGVTAGVWDVLVHSISEQKPFDAERRLWVR